MRVKYLDDDGVEQVADAFVLIGAKFSDGSNAANVVAEIVHQSGTFLGAGYVSAGTTQTLFQLWNPSNSGVNLILHLPTLEFASANANVQVYDATVALGTAITSRSGAQLLGAALPNGLLKSAVDTTVTGALIGQIRTASTVENKDYWTLSGTVIPPGRGLTFRLTSPVTIKYLMKWQEKAV